MMLNTAAQNLAGNEATMNSMERALIEPAFIRTLMRGGAPAEKINNIIDPLALIMGMGMWGSRVMGIRAQKIALARAGYGVPPPSEPLPQDVTATVTQITTPNGTGTVGQSVDDILRSNVI